MQKLVVILGTVIHLLPHPFGVSPIGALALYSGAFAPKRSAWLIPLLPLTLAGVIGGFYDLSVLLFVFAGFAASTFAGRWFLRSKRSRTRFTAAIASGAGLFFLFSNFGMWFAGYFPPTAAGLLECYVRGLPYLGQAMLADAAYCFVLFGVHRLLARRALKPRAA